MSLEVEKVLHDAKSKYQHVQCFKSKTWGNVLCLDGVFQLTEKDEMSYQEPIAHIPAFAHENPEHVLVVGGGDGGVIRELVKHSCIKTITICEIDEMVIKVAKEHIPAVAAAWDDKRVKLVTQDGSEWIKLEENHGKYDIIIADTSDPVGPAEALFEAPFYEAMYKALKPGGIACTQAETIWLNLELIQKLLRNSLKVYANAEYATTNVPTYPCGQIGFLLCSKGQEEKGRKRAKRKRGEPELPTCTRPKREIPADMKLCYYSAEWHEAAFVLPAFAQRAVQAAREESLAARAKEQEARAAKEEEEAKAARASKKDAKAKEKKEKKETEPKEPKAKKAKTAKKAKGGKKKKAKKDDDKEEGDKVEGDKVDGDADKEEGDKEAEKPEANGAGSDAAKAEA